MIDLVCKHCGTKATFASRTEAGDHAWSIVAMHALDEQQNVRAGGVAAFCPQTPERDVRAFLEAVNSAIVEGRILE